MGSVHPLARQNGGSAHSGPNIGSCNKYTHAIQHRRRQHCQGNENYDLQDPTTVRDGRGKGSVDAMTLNMTKDRVTRHLETENWGFGVSKIIQMDSSAHSVEYKIVSIVDERNISKLMNALDLGQDVRFPGIRTTSQSTISLVPPLVLLSRHPPQSPLHSSRLAWGRLSS